MCEVLKRIVTTVTRGARLRAVDSVHASHPSSGWPSVKESTNVHAVSCRFDFTRKRTQPVDSPVSRMGRRDVKLKTVNSFPDLSYPEILKSRLWRTGLRHLGLGA